MSLSNKYDAILVLANLMDDKGNLNAESRARMDAAVKSYVAEEAPWLVTTGWPYRADCPLAIGAVMRAYALDHYKIPADRVIADLNARDTVGDAIFTKRNVAGPRRWTRILVATSAYHADRTREIFNFVYGPDFHLEIRPAPSEASEELRQNERRSLEAFRGTFQGLKPGDDAAIFARLRERHPFYNGSVYAKI